MIDPMSSSTAWARRVSRWILAIGRAHADVDRALRDTILAWAPDPVLAQINDLVYGRQAYYWSGADEGRQGLFAWESTAIERFFPAPPARILIGGAGGGREAWALFELGYDVCAFEPSEVLVRAFADHRGTLSDGPTMYRAGYQDLPRLEEPGGEDSGSKQPTDLTELGPFDAGILGWGSLSHLASDAECREAVGWFSRVVRGPILASWQGPHARLGRRQRWFRRLLPGRRQRDEAAVFDWNLGFYRTIELEELTELIAGLGLVPLGGGAEPPGAAREDYPHAVFGPAPDRTA